MEDQVSQQLKDEDNSRPKKRQRMSVVCLNCKARKIKCDKKKPCCTNCEKSNVGHLCQYESPHWINRVTTSDGTPITVAAANSKNSVKSGSVGTDVESVMSAPAVDALNDEVRRLRALVSELDGSTNQALSNASLSFNGLNFTESVDFYGSYRSLIVKRSGMVEHKPLSCGSHDYKDQYSMVMLGYYNLGITFYNSKVVDEVKRKLDKGNKKSRIDASVLETMNILGEYDAPEVQAVAAKFVKERSSVTDKSQPQLPNLGSEISKSFADDLRERIERSLPPKNIIKRYLDRFYAHVYPFFPYIHKDFFDSRVFNTVLISNDYTSPVTVNITEKFDWVLIGTLLVVMRLTWIAFPDPEYLSDQDKVLLNYPIDPGYIANSVACLSNFKILRKTKLSIIQCLLYLRTYFTCAPEDGDGIELMQSQILFGILVQSAYTIGLNRDASHHLQMKHDHRFSNLWRKIWYGILEEDRFVSPISGYPCIIGSNTFNVQVPDPTYVSGHPSDALESTIASDLQKSQRMLSLYADLSNMINNVASPPKVTEVLSIIKQVENCCTINYSLSKLEKLTTNPNSHLKVNMSNVRRIQHTVQSLSLTLTVYQDLWLHFESKAHNDSQKALFFQERAISKAIELANVIYRYLKDGYQEYIDPSFLYLMNRYIFNAYQRVLHTFSSFLSRLYHAKDMIEREITPGHNLPKILMLTERAFKVAAGFLVLLQESLGRKYYLVFKASFKLKFFLRSLRKDGFKCVRDTVSFINQKFPGDSNARIRLLERVKLHLNPEELITELDNTNNIINLLPEQLDSYLNMINSCEILSDNDYIGDNLIWDVSFKEKHNSMDQFKYPTTNDINISLEQSTTESTGFTPVNEMDKTPSALNEVEDPFLFNFEEIFNNDDLIMDFELEAQLLNQETSMFDSLFKL